MNNSRIKKGTYNILYDFGSYTNYVKDYINAVYGKSLHFYKETYADSGISTGTQSLDIVKIEQALGYLEEYLYYFYHFYSDDFSKIFFNLLSKLEVISVFPPQKRGLYGQFVEAAKTLLINPELHPSRCLTSDERTRLYMAHELGHIINSDWMGQAKKIISESSVCDSSSKELAIDGFSLLDEAITQDRAEDIAYYFAHKIRPQRTSRRGSLFSGDVYTTNYDFYGELQQPAVMFSKTLRGIGSIEDDDLALRRLSGRALKSDFADDIFYEYEVDGQLTNLFELLKEMGTIKCASYATFGMDDASYILESKTAKDSVVRLTSSLRDVRTPLKKY